MACREKEIPHTKRGSAVIGSGNLEIWGGQLQLNVTSVSEPSWQPRKLGQNEKFRKLEINTCKICFIIFYYSKTKTN